MAGNYSTVLDILPFITDVTEWFEVQVYLYCIVYATS